MPYSATQWGRHGRGCSIAWTGAHGSLLTFQRTKGGELHVSGSGLSSPALPTGAESWTLDSGILYKSPHFSPLGDIVPHLKTLDGYDRTHITSLST